MKKILIVMLLLSFIACSKDKPETATNKGSENQIVDNTEMSANDYNNKGMDFYRQKDFVNAVKNFREAIKLNKNHPNANYNLACMYSLLVDECGMIELEDESLGESAVFEQLLKAVSINPGIRNKAPKDSDFKRYHNDIRFLNALDLLPAGNNLSGWTNILTSRKSWVLPECGMGVYESSCNSLSFQKDGTFTKNKYDWECLTGGKENCNQQNQRPGKYEIKNMNLILNYNDGSKETKALPLPEHTGDPCGV